MNEYNKKNFKQQLINNIGNLITLIIKFGNKCSVQTGVLCHVEENFLILINSEFKSEIPLEAIIALKKKIKIKK